MDVQVNDQVSWTDVGAASDTTKHALGGWKRLRVLHIEAWLHQLVLLLHVGGKSAVYHFKKLLCICKAHRILHRKIWSKHTDFSEA